MINVNIKATDIELTPQISDYLNKKIASLEKFVSENDEAAYADVEIGRTTNHHRTGNVYFTEINFKIANENMRARAEGDSLISSMDKAKDKALEVLREKKGRQKDH